MPACWSSRSIACFRTAIGLGEALAVILAGLLPEQVELTQLLGRHPGAMLRLERGRVEVGRRVDENDGNPRVVGPIDHPAEVVPEVIDDPLAPRVVAVIARQAPLVVEHGLDLGCELRPIVAGGAGQVMEQARARPTRRGRRCGAAAPVPRPAARSPGHASGGHTTGPRGTRCGRCTG